MKYELHWFIGDEIQGMSAALFDTREEAEAAAKRYEQSEPGSSYYVLPAGLWIDPRPM